MDKKNFEQTMKTFFEKAGVVLLKKGEEYKGGEETSSYILLDHKRKSFYLAESDIGDENDVELDEINDYFASHYNLPADVAKAILRLGRAGLFYNENFTVKAADITALIRKSAFIIDEKNIEVMSEFLKKRLITFQAVPYKGHFLVMFFDRNNSKKIAALYHKVSDEFLKLATGNPVSLGGQAMQLIDEINQTIRDNKLLFDIDASETFDIDEENLKKKDKKAAKSQDKKIDTVTESKVEINIEEEVTFEEKQALNAPIEKKKNKNDDSYFEPSKINNINDIKAKNAVNLSNIQNPDEKQEDDSATPILYKILYNLCGVIFFLPSYILNKVTFKKAPPFAIYAFAAVTIFFGLYQLIFASLGNIFYTPAVEAAQNAAIYASGLLGDGENVYSVDAQAGNIMTSALVLFFGQIAAMDILKNDGILKYLLLFSSILMIFPITRKQGAKLTVFFIICYFALPLILSAQTFIIDGAVQSKLPILKAAFSSGNQVVILSVVASSITFAVYILPVIALVLIYWVANIISPYKNNTHEVLP